jgi:methylated-DNA-[protein]-cysteine S-methyltransferase
MTPIPSRGTNRLMPKCPRAATRYTHFSMNRSGTAAKTAPISDLQSITLLIDRLPTPVGEMLIIADQRGFLRAISWSDSETEFLQYLHKQYGPIAKALQPTENPNGLTHAIHEYFEGNLKAIDALPVETLGTPFQKEVWSALRTIPCGTTISYSQLAAQIGRPAAVRAVGLANGSNPVGVIVPCHRVIGADGSLTGYGGGLPRKEWLLRHESALPQTRRSRQTNLF